MCFFVCTADAPPDISEEDIDRLVRRRQQAEREQLLEIDEDDTGTSDDEEEDEDDMDALLERVRLSHPSNIGPGEENRHGTHPFDDSWWVDSEAVLREAGNARTADTNQPRVPGPARSHYDCLYDRHRPTASQPQLNVSASIDSQSTVSDITPLIYEISTQASPQTSPRRLNTSSREVDRESEYLQFSRPSSSAVRLALTGRMLGEGHGAVAALAMNAMLTLTAIYGPDKMANLLLYEIGNDLFEYETKDEIGAGQFGRVYKGKFKQLSEKAEVSNWVWQYDYVDILYVASHTSTITCSVSSCSLPLLSSFLFLNSHVHVVS